MHLLNLALLAISSIALARPPSLELSLAARSKVCTVAASGVSTTDDTPAVAAAIKDCYKDGTILFKEGVDCNIFTPVNATGLSNVEIKLKGNLNLPQNITYVQSIVNATGGIAFWFTITGSNVHLTGTNNILTGWINSYGQAWWDANTGTGLIARPHLMKFISTGSITYFKSRKPVAWNFALAGNNLRVKHTFIDASSNGGFPFNTDGCDISAKNVLITDSVIINGDDAFTCVSGAENVVVRSALLGGPGCHGTSIGSLGQDLNKFATVKNVLYEDITMVNALYGARFKSWVGGQGLNITWRNYRLTNVSFPIFVTQTYINQGSAQTQFENGTINGRPTNSSVVMKNFTWENFKGDINTFQPGDGSCASDPCWYDNPAADGTQAIIKTCANSTSCNDFKVKDINLIPQSYAASTVLCANLQNSSSLGFLCQNGTFVGTH